MWQHITHWEMKKKNFNSWISCDVKSPQMTRKPKIGNLTNTTKSDLFLESNSRSFLSRDLLVKTSNRYKNIILTSEKRVEHYSKEKDKDL